MLKSMGETNFRTPTPPKHLNQFRRHTKYYYVPQGVDVQNFVGIDSAVTDLCRHEKRFCVDFFINTFIYLHVCFFVGATGHSFGAILTINGLNDVFSQPLVPFGGHINIAAY